MADPTLPADGDLTWGPTLRAALLDTSRRADGTLPKTTKTTSYTLGAGDVGTTVYMNSATALTVTVPTGVGAAEQRVLIRQQGAGAVTITAGSGMTLQSVGETPPFVMLGQHAMVELVWFSGTVVYVDGALA